MSMSLLAYDMTALSLCVCVPRLRASISHHDSAERFTKDLGVDVYIGKGVFTSPSTIAVNGKTLSFRQGPTHHTA